MNRYFFSITAALLITSAHAALFTSADGCQVTVPQLTGGADYSFEGFYWQPAVTQGTLDYASANTGFSPNFHSQLAAVNPQFQLGFGVSMGYLFANTGNDLNANYVHLDTNDSANAFAGSVTPFYFDAGHAHTQSSANAVFHFDEADLSLGQLINVGHRLQLHFLAGGRFAGIEEKLNSDSRGDTYQLNDRLSSNFNGVGPLTGVDADYALGKGIGLAGHVDSALLIGTRQPLLKTSEIETTSATVSVNNNNFSAASEHCLVPMIDEKVGLNYSHQFTYNQASLTLEAGYQTMKAWNAVDLLTASSTGMLSSHASGFSLNGPYAILSYRA